MLFNKIDFTDGDVIRRLQTKGISHHPTLAHYYEIYNDAISLIIRMGLQEHYSFNHKARGILFLLRHSLELCLKLNLERNGAPIPNTHDFVDLQKAYADPAIIPADFLTAMNALNSDSTGSCFRYLKDKGTGKRFYQLGDRIEFSEILKSYNSSTTSVSFDVGKISPVFAYDNRGTKWDLTLHMGESQYLGNIRSEFDATTEFLIKQLLNDNLTLDKIYLPLLFLVRHSLELALKANITEVQEFSAIIKSKDYQNEHSLATLYNVYRDYLNKIDINKLDPAVQRQYWNYRTDFEQLNATMHNLDANSRFFRYPFDKTGVPHKLAIEKIDMVQVLRLLYFTDTFITFSNVVFEEGGILV